MEITSLKRHVSSSVGKREKSQSLPVRNGSCCGLTEGGLCGPFYAKAKKFVGEGSQTPVHILTVCHAETRSNLQNKILLYFTMRYILFTDSIFLRMVIPGLLCVLDFSFKRKEIFK